MRRDPHLASAAIAKPCPVEGDDPEAWRAAYRAERDRLLEQRLPVTAAIYLVMVGLAIAVEPPTRCGRSSCRPCRTSSVPP